MRILANTYKWRLPRRNVELRAPLDLMHLSAQFPDVAVTAITSPPAVIAGNCVYAVDYLLKRLPQVSIADNIPWYFAMTHGTVLPSPATMVANYDLVFANESFPMQFSNCPIPVVLHTRIASAECMAAYGLKEDYARRERLLKSDWVRRASAVVVPSPGERKRLCDSYGAAFEKSFIIPSYLPWIEPTIESAVIAKQETSGPLKVLFIGNQARRKGLSEIAQAWRQAAVRTHITDAPDSR